MDYNGWGITGIEVMPRCLGSMMFGQIGNNRHHDWVRTILRALVGETNPIDTAGPDDIGAGLSAGQAEA
jgi:aryl-alcohol dehydrogenase-like predicted oxidoreductase